jgi:hypothetical protein
VDDDKRLVTLNFACGSLICQKDVDKVYKEAYSYPAGRERRAFLSYARILEKKLKKQKELDGDGTNNID